MRQLLRLIYTNQRCIGFFKPSTSRNYETGLFGHTELKDPSGFGPLTEKVKNESSKFVQEILSPDRNRKMVRIFDDLSNSLCLVADMTECIRNVHPDEKFVEAANNCMAEMHHIVESLNTNPALYNSLKNSTKNVTGEQLDEVDEYVAKLLLLDFEQSGVQLDEKKRLKFVQLAQEIFVTGIHFSSGADQPVIMKPNEVPDQFKSNLEFDGNFFHLSGTSPSSANRDLRQWFHRNYYFFNPAQEFNLTRLVSLRQEQAELCGFKSYAHRVLRNSFLSEPETVLEFLHDLAAKVKPRAEKEVEVIRQLSGDTDMVVATSDVPYYGSMLRNKKYSTQGSVSSKGFSLDEVMTALNSLVQSIFGVKMEMVPLRSGEAWHSCVEKMIIKDENENILGIIYCDFQDRSGKMSECHFTIAGGKEIGKNSYQTPVVTLSMSFRPFMDEKLYLSYGQMENLFHEFGHALHSILGRTRYQHVTGTRTSTDIAEIPSNVMEYFLFNKKVLSNLFTSNSVKNSLDNLIKSRFVFPALELQTQLIYAIFDLNLHMNTVVPSNTSDLMREVQNEYTSLPFVDNTVPELDSSVDTHVTTLRRSGIDANVSRFYDETLKDNLRRLIPIFGPLTIGAQHARNGTLTNEKAYDMFLRAGEFAAQAQFHMNFQRRVNILHGTKIRNKDNVKLCNNNWPDYATSSDVPPLMGPDLMKTILEETSVLAKNSRALVQAANMQRMPTHGPVLQAPNFKHQRNKPYSSEVQVVYQQRGGQYDNRYNRNKSRGGGNASWNESQPSTSGGTSRGRGGQQRPSRGRGGGQAGDNYRYNFLAFGGEKPAELLFKQFFGRYLKSSELTDALIREIDFWQSETL